NARAGRLLRGCGRILQRATGPGIGGDARNGLLRRLAPPLSPRTFPGLVGGVHGGRRGRVRGTEHNVWRGRRTRARAGDTANAWLLASSHRPEPRAGINCISGGRLSRGDRICSVLREWPCHALYHGRVRDAHRQRGGTDRLRPRPAARSGGGHSTSDSSYAAAGRRGTEGNLNFMLERIDLMRVTPRLLFVV